MYKQLIQSQQRAGSIITSHMVGSKDVEYRTASETSPWERQRGRRQAFRNKQSVRAEAERRSIRQAGLSVGSSHHRSVRITDHSTDTSIQQSVLRPRYSRSGLPCSNRLGSAQQLRQSTLLDNPESASGCATATGDGHLDSTMVASTAVDTRDAGHADRCANTDKEQTISDITHQGRSRAVKEPSMEVICLEDMWCKKLTSKGWNQRPCVQMPSFLARSTLELYDRCLSKLHQFCVEAGVVFPPTESSVLADFLCYIADSSSRPRGQLVSVSAAIGHCYGALNRDNLMNDRDIRQLVTALVKSGTTAPRIRSKIMPVEPFHRLFLSWPDNICLDVKRLRLKAITLWAFVMMMQPSDFAPKACYFNNDTLLLEKLHIKTDQLVFNNDKSLDIMLHGIKNDYKREEFPVHIPAASNSHLDPVAALSVYLDITKQQRPKSGAVFLSIRKPHSPIDSTTVSKILQEAIDLAGLKG